MKETLIKDEETQVQFPQPQKKENTHTIIEEWQKHYLKISLGAISILFIALVATLTSIFPLKSIKPYSTILTRERDVTVNIIPPYSFGLNVFQQIAQDKAKEYVRLRHEIVRSNRVMQQRWGNPGIVYLESGKDVYLNFVHSMSQNLQDIREQNATIEVQNKTFSVVQDWVPDQRGKSGHGFYQLHYTLIGRDANDKIIFQKNYIAQLEVAFSPLKKVPYTLRYYNPWGFVVVSYDENPEN